MAQAPAAVTETTNTRVPTRRLFTVEEFERMGEVGILHEDDHIELIEGEIIEMAAKGDPHILCIVRSIRLFNQQLAEDLWLAVQDPIRLGRRSKPEPDLLVYRMPAGTSQVAPNAENTLLVVEVADSSLRYDRDTKFPLDARAGIPEAWLFDLANARIERHNGPRADGYAQIVVAGRGETVESLVVPGLKIPVNAVFGLGE